MSRNSRRAVWPGTELIAANTSALGFYKRQGYTPDEIDPTRCAKEEGEEAEYSYRILSKEL